MGQFDILKPCLYAVLDPQGHDIKLNTLRTSVALKFMTKLHNLTTTNQRKIDDSKYDGTLSRAERT